MLSCRAKSQNTESHCTKDQEDDIFRCHLCLTTEHEDCGDYMKRKVGKVGAFSPSGPKLLLGWAVVCKCNQT